jgi:hypothetical protein
MAVDRFHEIACQMVSVFVSCQVPLAQDGSQSFFPLFVPFVIWEESA